MRAGDLFLGRYQVVERIGSGGMGVVWKARDTVADIEVAIKAVPPDVSADPAEMQEIRANFQLVRTLTHPNIVTLRALEKDPETGAFFVVQDYVPGVNLKAYRRSQPGGKLSPEDAVRIAGEIAKALDFAHSKRVVHRDVKPENVMVAPTGEVLVTDFGLAMQIMTSVSRVSRQVFDTSGTRPYMAPEQWQGGLQDAATDQYALGVVFHELVTGRVPFENADPGVLREMVLRQAPPVAEVLSKARRAALVRALAKGRKERFPSCSAFAAELRGDRKPLSARTLLALAAVVLIAGLAAGAGLFSLNAARGDLDRALETIADQIEVPAGQVVAVGGFADSTATSGEAHPLGREVADRLTTLLASRRVQVVERGRIRVVEQEMDVARGEENESPSPEVREKLGLRMGAHLVLTGSYTVSPIDVRISARLVGVSNAQVLDGASATVRRSSFLAALAPVSTDAKSASVKSETSPTPPKAASPEPPPRAAPALVDFRGKRIAPEERDRLLAAEEAERRAQDEQRLALERNADLTFQRKQYTSPPNESAVALYQQILKRWPGHELAVSRLRDIRDFYLDQAAKAEASGNLDEADHALASALLAVPDDAKIEARRTTLAEKRKAEEARPAEEARLAGEARKVEEVRKKAQEAAASSGMVPVPAGSFTMGTDVGGQADEKPAHEVFLDAFFIDKTEVTVAAYRRCADAGSCSTVGLTSAGACNWGRGRDDHPVNCVDWTQARTYCEWAGRRLPTEAEWEKAARGTDGRTYPWGSASASCEHAVMDDGGNGCGRQSTWPVGSKPRGASSYGALDMAGNVWEWVADWYDASYYAGSPSRNPTGPSSGQSRVVRGGSWFSLPDALRAARRTSYMRAFRFDIYGFRCAGNG